MVCEKYKVKIEVIALEEELIDSRYTTTSEEGKGDKIVCIVNYMEHFVPLLSRIFENITENKPVSGNEIFSKITGLPVSNQLEQEKQHNIRTSKLAIVKNHKE